MATDRDDAPLQIPLSDVNAKLAFRIGELNHEIAMKDVLIEMLQAKLREVSAKDKETTDG